MDEMVNMIEYTLDETRSSLHEEQKNKYKDTLIQLEEKYGNSIIKLSANRGLNRDIKKPDQLLSTK